MRTEKYYIVKQGDKEFRCETKAAAYEMWYCLKRKDVVIEYHYLNLDSGKHDIHIVTRPRRRTLKTGEIKYYFPWIKKRD